MTTNAGNHRDVHTLSLVTRDKPGVLVRIALVFSRRGYNIESLSVSHALREGFARMTITSRGAPEGLEQIIKQLGKLIDVVYVTDHRSEDPIETEIALVKLRDKDNRRVEILQIAEQYEARLVDFSGDTMILRVEGAGNRIDTFISMLAPYHIEEMVRSGKVVLERGPSHFANMINDGL
jgi:acetolactate synthase small subunit